jgi:hypothetical protein
MAKREKEHSLERFNFFHQAPKNQKKIYFNNFIQMSVAIIVFTVVALMFSGHHSVKKNVPNPIALDVNAPISSQPVQELKISESSAMMQTALEAVNVVMDTPQDTSAIKAYMTEDGFALYQQEIKDPKNQEIIKFKPDNIKVENITLSEIKNNRYFMFVDIKESVKSLEKKTSVMVVLEKNMTSSSQQKPWEVSSLQFVHSNDSNQNEIVK